MKTMLTLTQQQVQVLGDAVRNEARTTLAELVASKNPALAQRLPQGPILELAELALQKASAHAVHSLAHVYRIARLMLHFGSDFDEDPMLPGIGAALISGGSADARTSKAIARAGAYRSLVAGTQNEHLLAALRRLGELAHGPAEVIEDPTALRARLHALYPQKLEALRWDSIHAHGLRVMADLGRRSPEETLLFFAGWLFLGIGFERDPLYPFRNATHEPVHMRRRLAFDFLSGQLGALPTRRSE